MTIKESTLKKKRLDAELTQKQLAMLAGVSQAHIAKIEGGKVNPRMSTVNKILRVLDRRKGGKKCGEIMTQGLIITNRNEKIRKISELMIRYAISQIPVIEEKRIIGMVTEEGMIRHLDPNMADFLVEKIMEPPLPVVPEGTEINTIKPLLEIYPGVLITKDGELVGIITRSDLLKIISNIM